MARKKETPKPLFAVKHEYDASLERFIHEAGMLGDAVRTLLSMGASFPGADILKERVTAFDAARFGEEDGASA